MTWLGLALFCSVSAISIALLGQSADAGRKSAVKTLSESAPTVSSPAPLATAYATASALNQAESEAQEEVQWLKIKIKPGDTLSGLFDHYSLPTEDWLAIIKADDDTKRLKRLRTGDELRIRKSAQGNIAEIQYDLSKIKTLKILRTADGFESHIQEAPVEHRVAYAVGNIDSSMFLAAKQAGLDNEVAMELANIFGWDIDFALDIRSGDRFSVVYEEIFSDGEKVGNGNILAAEFINKNKTHQAFLYTQKNGDAQYYDADGNAMRKAFLRTPVDFARISSHFNLRRRHPVLNRIRAHKGVDYAAPSGTPIKATGDGKIVFRGRKGGYGNVVILKHGTRYSTLYGHMSRFASGQRNGSSVRQGEVIGYVGSTGLATGPHLHYEFRVNDVHVNPLTVKIPSADPLPKKYQRAFAHSIEPLVAQLNTLAEIQLADASR